MRLKSASAKSSDAFALSTSGTRPASKPWLAARPRRASSCAAFASASRSDASASVADSRTSTVPADTRVPRSTGVPITRPAVSAATSAFSSGEIEPVTRRYRSIDWVCAWVTFTATAAGSGGAAALVRSPLQAAEKSAAVATPASNETRSLRIMTLVLADGMKTAVLARHERKSEMTAGAGAQADQGGVDRRARELVGVLARGETITEAQRRGAVRGGQQQPERRMRRRVGRAGAGVNRFLDAQHHVVLHLADEAEALPVIADPRHAAVEEHQREILGMLFAELVVAPEHRPQQVAGLLGQRLGASLVTIRKEEAEPLFREGEEDVVLARKIAVDGRRAVLDTVRDLADRDLLVAVRNEELTRRVQNRPGDRLSLSFLSFFYAQVIDVLVLSAYVAPTL